MSERETHSRGHQPLERHCAECARVTGTDEDEVCGQCATCLEWHCQSCRRRCDVCECASCLWCRTECHYCGTGLCPTHWAAQATSDALYSSSECRVCNAEKNAEF
jgi:hypothetical protein